MKTFENCLDWLVGLVASCVLLYIATAPPILNALMKSSGRFSYPAIYSPIVNVLESDYGDPLLWYFNDVWHSGIIRIGEETGPSWPIIALYAITGSALIITMLFPLIRRIVRRKIVRL